MAIETTIERLGSDVSSETGGETIEDMVLDSPLYYVLGQFLETEKTNKNIATLIEELVSELRDVKIQIKRVADAATLSSEQFVSEHFSSEKVTA